MERDRDASSALKFRSVLLQLHLPENTSNKRFRQKDARGRGKFLFLYFFHFLEIFGSEEIINLGT